MSGDIGVDPTSEETPEGTASRIADLLAPLVRQARDQRFNFLAYLLGMALKEARKLAAGDKSS